MEGPFNSCLSSGPSVYVGNRFFQYLLVCFLIYENLETKKRQKWDFQNGESESGQKVCKKGPKCVPSQNEKMCRSVFLCEHLQKF